MERAALENQLSGHVGATLAAMSLFLSGQAGSIKTEQPFKLNSGPVQIESQPVQIESKSVQFESKPASQFKPSSQDSDFEALVAAIIGQESNGRYNLTNPDSDALGACQIMPSNLPSWSKKHVGREVGRDEFLRSPSLQLKICKGQLRVYWQREAGKLEELRVRRVASTWYSGRPNLWNNTKPQYYNGRRYPSIADYTKSVWEKYQKEKRLNDLAKKIVTYSKNKGYKLYTSPGEKNIIYIEGMNLDGSLNDNALNSWNDLRIVLEFFEGSPKITGIWEATTAPGKYYTDNPMNPQGAAIIKPGQYWAWKVGTHGTKELHSGLIQTAGKVKVYRDKDKNGKRTGDKTNSGFFGINHHWGYDYPQRDIKKGAAGCLVGRTRAGHREFMKLIKQDPRYQDNQDFIFGATIIPGSELQN
ncbi:MAG: lytic transglycosylase domain-containing protein [Symploca sp. SIO3C6]|nr:lytic transglycosylase domain-containing protein [Symploca sp. SIO3C6]